MLYSNIYIPDYESESKYEETNFSDQKRGDGRVNQLQEMSMDPRRFSTLDPATDPYQRIYDKYKSLQPGGDQSSD